MATRFFFFSQSVGSKAMNQASQDCKKLKDTIFYKIIRIISALILVNSCVYMRVCNTAVTRAVRSHEFGYALSDARFDWLFQSISNKNSSSFIY